MKLVRRPGLALLFFVAGTLLLSIDAPSQRGAQRARPPAQQPRPGTGTASATPTPQPPSSARGEWEAKRDWAAFASNVVGDAAVRDSLKQLLESGVDANTQDKQGRTALHVAAMLGQTELARYLLSRGAGVDARDRLGRTPLMLSAGLGGFKLFSGISSTWAVFWTDQPCPERGSDDASGRWRRELLDWYVMAAAHPPLVRLLIESGADVNAVDSERQTVLDHAGMGGPTEIDRLILASGRVRGGRQCELKLAQAPALRGFRLGMTLSEVSGRFPYYQVPEADSCGRVNISLDSSFDRLRRGARRPEEFDGVKGVRLAFLDGRLAYVGVTYEGGEVWKSMDEYLASISSGLGLGGSWHKADDSPAWSRAHAMGCDGFKVVAGIDLGAYAELHDVTAIQSMLRRKVEDDARRKREAEQERERRRRAFKP